MAWTNLPTNYTDATWTGNKTYSIKNTDTSTTFNANITDTTSYTNEQNSFFGAADANQMNGAINDIMTGAVELTGTKTFLGNPVIKSTSLASVLPGFIFQSSVSTSPVARIGASLNSSTGRINFFDMRCYSYDSSTNLPLTYFEAYNLPSVTPDKIANSRYEILTSREVVTVAQGGSGMSAVEVGTWTPTITWGTSSSGPAVSSPTGMYYKWGPMILYLVRFNVTSVNAPSTATYLSITTPYSNASSGGIPLGRVETAYSLNAPPFMAYTAAEAKIRLYSGLTQQTLSGRMSTGFHSVAILCVEG